VPKPLAFIPRLAIFLAGAAVGAISLSRRDTSAAQSGSIENLKRSLADVEKSLSERVALVENRSRAVEARMDEQAAKLAELPTTAQIVAAMEQLISKTMASLDDRLTTQANSIEILKTTVTQTDNLLERVLESLDSLQTYTDSAELAHDALLQRGA
jgi:uncharacterized coiled-coil protein SlyX